MTYIDPNSGAAPQPGGYVGPQGAELGYAQPEWIPVEEDKSVLNETDDIPEEKSVEEVAKAAEEAQAAEDAKSEEQKQQELVEANANPAKVLAEAGQENEGGEAPEPGAEENASDQKALETEAILPGAEAEQEEQSSGEAEQEAYDPSQYYVADVLAYIEQNPDQKDAVLAAEKAGKNRAGITG